MFQFIYTVVILVKIRDILTKDILKIRDLKPF